MTGPHSWDLAVAMHWRTSPARLRQLVGHLSEQPLPVGWSERDLARREGVWPREVIDAVRDLPGEAEVRRCRARMEEKGISLLVRGGDWFPPELSDIPDPPPYLFVRGEPFTPAGARRVAVIGSRAASAVGREIAYSLGRDLALAGLEVVSGMARGIDGEAHRGALEAGGRTIAVLGTGADVCYPPEHDGLFRRILKRGGVVTEFPPGVPGLKPHFPRRNRVLAGLAEALVVVEGGERSGARSSVDHALDQGREVLAVPRDIVHPGSALPNRLIRDGARPVLDVRDILESLQDFHPAASLPGKAAANAPKPGGSAGAPEEPSGADDLETRLLDGLRRKRLDLEGCLRLAPRSGPGIVQAALSRLEVMGWITRLPGGRFTVMSRTPCGR